MDFPAAPVGGLVMLARDLFNRDLPAGLRLHTRLASTHHQEVTDGTGHCHVVTAPQALPSAPDMDAVRRAHGPKAPPKAEVIATSWSVEADNRGEELIHREEDRRTAERWTWNGGRASTRRAWARGGCIRHLRGHRARVDGPLRLHLVPRHRARARAGRRRTAAPGGGLGVPRSSLPGTPDHAQLRLSLYAGERTTTMASWTSTTSAW